MVSLVARVKGYSSKGKLSEKEIVVKETVVQFSFDVAEPLLESLRTKHIVVKANEVRRSRGRDIS